MCLGFDDQVAFSLNVLLLVGLTLVLQQRNLFVPYPSHDQILSSFFFFFFGQKIRINYYFQSKSYYLRVSLYFFFSHFFLLRVPLNYYFFLLSTFSKKIKINNQLILFSFQLLSIILSAKKKLDKLFPNIKYLLLSLEGSNGKEEKKKKSSSSISHINPFFVLFVVIQISN